MEQERIDNKKHCISCIWFEYYGEEKTFGVCRKHAPTNDGFPVVFMDSYCGDQRIA